MLCINVCHPEFLKSLGEHFQGQISLQTVKLSMFEEDNLPSVSIASFLLFSPQFTSFFRSSPFSHSFA